MKSNLHFFFWRHRDVSLYGIDWKRRSHGNSKEKLPLCLWLSLHRLSLIRLTIFFSLFHFVRLVIANSIDRGSDKFALTWQFRSRTIYEFDTFSRGIRCNSRTFGGLFFCRMQCDLLQRHICHVTSVLFAGKKKKINKKKWAMHTHSAPWTLKFWVLISNQRLVDWAFRMKIWCCSFLFGVQ